MFENGVIRYVVDGSVCIVTYEIGSVIDNEQSDIIVSEKEKLSESHNIKRFVGVLHSSVKVKPETMRKFTTSKALNGVDVIAVVYVADKKVVEKIYKIGVKTLNLLARLMLKSPRLRFFNDEKSAIKWAKSLVL